ncbi:hypothetical protein [Streptomyces sp. NPDC005017]|uniref:hypothetical protein n=1 Tax=Streptomyces sp. NPDC005017 TaxID=3364706 RepID=UPI00367DDB23
MGFLLGLGVVGSSFFLPWWGTLLLIAGAWFIGVLGRPPIGGAIGAGMVPFGGFLVAAATDKDFASYAPIALAGFIAMGGLILYNKDREDRD